LVLEIHKLPAGGTNNPCYRLTGRDNLEPLPWIGMKTADDKFVPWLASQTDVLANDWCVVTPIAFEPQSLPSPEPVTV